MELEQKQIEERLLHPINGMLVFIVNTILIIVSLFGFVLGIFESGWLMLVCGLYAFLLGPILYAGIKVLKPNEAYVFTLFGTYYGTLKQSGIFFVNPFVTAFHPNHDTATVSLGMEPSLTPPSNTAQIKLSNKKISMKTLTLSNEKQKVNDQLGNPIIIGIVVIWRVKNTAQAVFNVDNYREFLSIQCDSSLRNIVRLYPYDVSSDGDEKSLRGSSQEVAESLKEEIQARVKDAGLEIMEARITHLAYAPEIAAVMLQRQQASAIIDARKMIVEGAVGMVEMALQTLSQQEIVVLDDERKAQMVSNLLVVLCGNKDAQPIVNSGSIY
ncbi:MAG: SPFH domain-containing protein [Erysipelotrichaceae bacterium]